MYEFLEHNCRTRERKITRRSCVTIDNSLPPHPLDGRGPTNAEQTPYQVNPAVTVAY